MIALCSDVHVGNHRRCGGAPIAGINARAQLVLAALEQAVAEAVAAQARAFVVAGDLFDYQRPEPQLIAAVQLIFERFSTTGGTVYVMVGNHDQVSSSPGDHALGPLQTVATVVDKPTVVETAAWSLTFVPCLPPGEEAATGLRAALKHARKREPFVPADRSALVVHMGIRDEDTAPWLRDSRGAIDANELATVAKEHGRGIVFAGDWHDRRTWDVGGVRLVQMGALAPTGWDNPGWKGYGGLALWEPARAGGVRWVEVPGPRFITAGSADELPAIEAEAARRGCSAFVELGADPDEARALRSELLGRESSRVLVDVVVDRSLGKAKARTAATAARSAETLDEALSAYVKRMEVAPGVVRDEVTALARGYLTKGRDPR